MPAKKNIIRDQRIEIQQLNQDLAEMRRELHAKDNQIKCLIDQSDTKLWQLQMTATGIAEVLRNQFLKELTWLELSDDSDSKFQTIKESVKALRRMGA